MVCHNRRASLCFKNHYIREISFCDLQIASAVLQPCFFKAEVCHFLDVKVLFILA